MDRCPVEILIKIFAFACTDGGFTGCSLSLVSTFIREVSGLVKHQSVALKGLDQTARFNDFIHTSPFPMRSRVRHLFVDYWKKKRPLPPDKDFNALSDADLIFALETYIVDPHHTRDIAVLVRNRPGLTQGIATRQVKFYSTLRLILTSLSSELETMSLVLTARPNTYNLFYDITFPSLVEYSVIGGRFPVVPHPGSTSVPQKIFPSLRYLHLSGGLNDALYIIKNSPSLTHLRLSEVINIPSALIAVIELLFAPPDHFDSSQPPKSLLPSTLVKLLVQPAKSTYRAVPTVYKDWAEKSKTWESDRRFVLLPSAGLSGRETAVQPDQHAPAYDLAEAQWRARLDGGLGCWEEAGARDVHVNFRSFWKDSMEI